MYELIVGAVHILGQLHLSPVGKFKYIAHPPIVLNVNNVINGVIASFMVIL